MAHGSWLMELDCGSLNSGPKFQENFFYYRASLFCNPDSSVVMWIAVSSSYGNFGIMAILAFPNPSRPLCPKGFSMHRDNAKG
jgi:hypothetical protein